MHTYIHVYIHTHTNKHTLNIHTYIHTQVARRRCEEQSALDECNGKVLAHSGIYAYFLTPNYPYAPACLRREHLGAIVDDDTDAREEGPCPRRSWGS